MQPKEKSGLQAAPSISQRPSYSKNKAGLFRQEGKAREVDEIFIMVNHFVDGKIYSRVCTFSPHDTLHNS